MAGKRRDVLTEEVEKKILAGIRQGAYELVAAEAAGVPAEVYKSWLGRAKQRSTPAKFRQFAYKVMEAKAQARLFAEIELRQKDPKFWLTRGPGKETVDFPGWSKEVKPQLPVTSNTQINLLAPEAGPTWDLIMRSLAAFPEARAALADAAQQLIELPKAKS